jgi:hypothetical protein
MMNMGGIEQFACQRVNHASRAHRVFLFSWLEKSSRFAYHSSHDGFQKGV